MDKQSEDAYNLKWEESKPIKVEKTNKPKLHNPDLLDILENTYEYEEEKFEWIFNMPHDILREDLEAIIRYKMGNTSDITYMETGMVFVIMCLAEVGDEGSLRLILDSLRLDDWWHLEIMLYDTDYAYRNTLIKLGRNHLDWLAKFMCEPGRAIRSRDVVMHAVADMAQHWPEMRAEVVEWFRTLLNFYIEALPKKNTKGCDSRAAAYAIISIHDFGGYELTDEVERLFDTG